MERVEARRLSSVAEVRAQAGEVAERDARLAVAATEHKTLKRLRERQRAEHERQTALRETSGKSRK